MDPLGTTLVAISAINYLKGVVDKVGENREECRRFYDYASTLRDLIESEYSESGVPPSLCLRLSKLTR